MSLSLHRLTHGNCFGENKRLTAASRLEGLPFFHGDLSPLIDWLEELDDAFGRFGADAFDLGDFFGVSGAELFDRAEVL